MTESAWRVPSIDGYDDLTEIGRGGFAIVFRATQTVVGREVALKVLTDQLTDERALNRFERECRAMGGLSWHPNIVSVFDAGVAGSQPYLAMEYLEGGSFDDRLATEGALGYAEVLDTGIHLAGALEAAHRAGIHHRDVKPANILIGELGEAKLTDFGIARVSDMGRTTTGMITATVAYSAPEVLQGSEVSAITDVYSLGATLYALLAGGPAYVKDTDENIVPLILRIVSEPPPDLPAEVPPEVAAVIIRSMAKSPDDRFESCLAFGEALLGAQEAVGLPPTRLVVERAAGRPPRVSDIDAGPVTDISAGLKVSSPTDAVPLGNETLLIPPPNTSVEHTIGRPIELDPPVTPRGNRRLAALVVGGVALGAVAVIGAFALLSSTDENDSEDEEFVTGTTSAARPDGEDEEEALPTTPVLGDDGLPIAPIPQMGRPEQLPPAPDMSVTADQSSVSWLADLYNSDGELSESCIDQIDTMFECFSSEGSGGQLIAGMSEFQGLGWGFVAFVDSTTQEDEERGSIRYYEPVIASDVYFYEYEDGGVASYEFYPSFIDDEPVVAIAYVHTDGSAWIDFVAFAEGQELPEVVVTISGVAQPCLQETDHGVQVVSPAESSHTVYDVGQDGSGNWTVWKTEGLAYEDFTVHDCV